MVEPGWTLAHPWARLQLATLHAEVDVRRPNSGMTDLKICSATLRGTLLCLALDEGPVGAGRRSAGEEGRNAVNFREAYVRGGDLVASYQRVGNPPFRLGVYWRMEQVADPASFSLIVSIETDSLNSRPALQLETSLLVDEVIVLHGTPDDPKRTGPLPAGCHAFDASAEQPVGACVVYRPPGDQVSYVEATTVADFRQLQIHSEDGSCWKAQWHLLGQFLEKGVIRRARVQAFVLRREDDLATAAALYRALQNSAIPLTA